ncbi:HNH endonuclease [Paenibacillus turpanensis]|uniref:HNH endonuclease n=1 Tax=Paenibacillus turpanensis TaxID=2689078 RepID=UPI001408DA57|nr:HNH endonuclease [Paenibacillus turpanensis]
MGKRSDKLGVCELCGRENIVTTVHHLTPKERGGTLLPTADFCIACHKQVHALFTNAQLEQGLNTIEALRANEQLSAYLKWIVKQPSSAVPRVKKSKAVRSGR